MTRRSDVLSLAILGLLTDSPLHGYELRKRLDLLIGPLRRRISFGSLYPALRALQADGLITAPDQPAATDWSAPARRSRVVYRLTPAGEEHLAQLLTSSGPGAWEDELFDVHFVFFGRTDAETRLRILEGRRTRMQERLERVRQSLDRTHERRDGYAAELQQHALESVEREVRWLDGLIDRERAERLPRAGAAVGGPLPDQAHDEPDPTHQNTDQTDQTTHSTTDQAVPGPVGTPTPGATPAAPAGIPAANH